jgi:hypothetical protein
MEPLQQKLQLVHTSLWLHNPKQFNREATLAPVGSLTLTERK